MTALALDNDQTSAARQPATQVPPALAVEKVGLRFGALTALEAVSLSIQPGEILCLLGPSGSGKSSLLRLLAGLDRPTTGRILLDGVEVAGPSVFVEAEARRVGMVFQDYALFPHLTVAANVAFGLRGRRPGEAGAEVESLLRAVGLETRAACYPHMLSGGERQRVALARALAPRPRVLLLDEPFSGLDGRLRDQVRDDTIAMLRSRQTTTVLVTHDAGEALRLADRIVLLEQGRLVQVGCPAELYERPGSLSAARAFGDVNAFVTTCRNGWVETPLGRFDVPEGRTGGHLCVCVRPQHVQLSCRRAGVRGRVQSVAFLGGATDVVVALDGSREVIARVAGPAPFRPDDDVFVSVAASDVLVFSDRDAAGVHPPVAPKPPVSN